MSKKVQGLGIVCEAPPYAIVQACAQVGIQAPEDVRWCEAHQFLRERHLRLSARKGESWNELLHLLGPRHMACACAGPLPPLNACRFLCHDGSTLVYHVGQCRRCRRVYWTAEGPVTTH